MSENSASAHLVIACGGTGGHFYPTLAVAREYSKRGGTVTLLVSGKHAAEQEKIAVSCGFCACELQAVRLPNNPLAALLFPFQFCHCVLKARRVLRSLRPDILLGMGSFAAVPACLALSRKELPLVLHEGNAFMGKANRFLAGKATAIALSLPLRYPAQLKGKPSTLVGMPLREAIVEGAKRKQAPETYLSGHGLSPERRSILVFGGSQGAHFINELVLKSLSQLGELASNLQFIHLTGSDNNQELLTAYQEAGIPAIVQRGEANIENCYLAADLVVCRGGASSICELALFGKPLLIIPLPTAADDHQRINAEMLQEKQAAKLLPQNDSAQKLFLRELFDWHEKPEQWEEMGKRLLAFAKHDAASAMTDLLQQVLDKTRTH
jgi:UDP-N-acetylglucosamine--N-acetylmuramyl-(pentapeptide) pyrophosphoryl-undecaprenol N-acetylglucosamine transferase